MAKLKNSFTSRSTAKLPALSGNNLSTTDASKITAPRDSTSRALSLSRSGTVGQALNFGDLHTKSESSQGQSGSQWLSLLSSASGGGTAILGGGLLSAGGFGLISSLISLFGGGKSTPSAPVQFQSPVARQNSLDIAPPGAASAVSLGVQQSSIISQATGIYQQVGTSMPEHLSQSSQVVQIVKQALLTSSSLNDVISEI